MNECAMTVLLDMSAFEVSQFADDFLLPLMELEIIIRFFLRSLVVVSDGLWFSEWPHYFCAVRSVRGKPPVFFGFFP
jgi:hypothetical protein